MSVIEKKSSFINFIRGLAIFLMLWGHSIQYASRDTIDIFEDSVFRFIYLFYNSFHLFGWTFVYK